MNSVGVSSGGAPSGAVPSGAVSHVPVLSLAGVHKHFGGIQALRGVDLDLYAGEVVALLGENGAGKSTAVKIMTGVYRPDAGEVRVAGTPVELRSTQDAWRHGIAAVYQETVMFDDLSVAENIFMGHLVTRRTGLLDFPAMKRRARAILDGLESDLEVDTLLGALSVAQKHLVAIARALSHDARVLIMDEPTAALSSREVEELYRITRHLTRAGTAILFISHKLDEIFAIADRYAVFRDGNSVGHGAMTDVDEDRLVQLMVGRTITEIFPKTTAPLGEPVLEVRELGNETEFADISFTLHKSEVLGFYGLVGSGRTELMETIFGLEHATRGSVTMNGRALGSSPREAIEQGLVLVPEDRQRNGAVLGLSVRENLSLPSLPHLSRNLWVDTAAEEVLARAVVERLSIKCHSLEQALSDLSGGNQQKVVIGKWLATQPKIVILDEPTKGIDIGSKSAVHAFVGELVAQGVSVILVSSELPEVMGIADRIVVMHKGRMVRVIERSDFDAPAIVRAAIGIGVSSSESVYAELASAS
jgi:rhamnose transport system ATP-binding protein